MESMSITLRNQVQAINDINSLEDINIAYATLRQILIDLSETNDLSVKLLNYQVIAYLSQTLQRRQLTVIQQNYQQSIESINAGLSDLFKSYMSSYQLRHIVQSRQDNVFHIEIAFSTLTQKSPFITISIATDAKGTLFDLSVVLSSQQIAASSLNDNDWYALQDKINLERLILLRCQNYDDFKPFVEQAIATKLNLGKQQLNAEQQYASLLEDFSTDMYEALEFIADAKLDFCMRSILPRHDNLSGFEMLKYRVSHEKIHNINVDTSIVIFDGDGEIETPEEFVRFESIRKRELQSFMQNKLAFITVDEYENRFDETNTFNWFD